MKNKKLKEMIQKPLRFHHQDIHEEFELLKKETRGQYKILTITNLIQTILLAIILL